MCRRAPDLSIVAGRGDRSKIPAVDFIAVIRLRDHRPVAVRVRSASAAAERERREEEEKMKGGAVKWFPHFVTFTPFTYTCDPLLFLIHLMIGYHVHIWTSHNMLRQQKPHPKPPKEFIYTDF